METEIFTLCDFAQDTNGKLTIVGTFDRINNIKSFPYTHPACSVASRLRFSSKETGEHTFKLHLVNNAGKEISSIDGNLNINNTAGADYVTINIPVNFAQLKFEAEGRYSFELYIDGKWVSGLPLILARG
jgi:hypothetical protein